VKRADRPSLLKAAEDRFDLLVIGGGALGAGIALDAASRGLKTLLVEGEDFGAGASSRSSKLFHRGTNDLAGPPWSRASWRGARRALREVTTIFAIAPHLTWRRELVVPYKSALFGARVYTALRTFELFAQTPWLGRARRLDREEAEALHPLLDGAKIRGAVAYTDAQFDDVRLGVALVLSALKAGAVVLNHVAATGLLLEEGKVVGAELEDRLGGGRFAARARFVVNAAGTGAEAVLRLADPEARLPGERVAGAHAVLPGRFAPTESGLALPQGRGVRYLLPWQAHGLLGRSERPAPAGAPVPEEEELKALLTEASAFLKNPLEPKDLRSAWSGIRLRLEKEPYAVLTSPTGLVTALTERWTCYRRAAEEVLDLLDREHGLGLPAGKTERLPLVGGERYDPREEADLAVLLDPETARHLARTYGDQARSLLEFAKKTAGLQRLVPGLPYLEAEVRWAARFELAETPLDFLVRRVRLAYLELEAARRALGRTTEILAEEKGWSPAQAERLRKEAETQLARAP